MSCEVFLRTCELQSVEVNIVSCEVPLRTCELQSVEVNIVSVLVSSNLSRCEL